MAAWSERHPPAKRRAVAALMRESDLTMMEVAQETGIPYGTVSRWNILRGWRPALTRRKGVDEAAGWPSERIVALGRVYGTPGVEARDLAQALGFRREDAETVFGGCGFAVRKPSRRRIARDGSALRAALRAHVARQIEAFDALLTADSRLGIDRRLSAGKRLDSAKILRDLGGLTRLLDDLDKPSGPPAQADRAEAPVDLVALRERIARRCEVLARAQPER